MINEFDIADVSGLSDHEAATRLNEDGYNELPSKKRRSIFVIAYEVIREPMFVLLIAAGTVYVFLGDIEEALILLSFVFVIMGITFYQERRTERALEALRDLSSPRALVIRNGEQRRIAGRDVVRDDILLLAEGDRVPADAVLLTCRNLSVDESLLTGESVSVRKVAWDGATEMGRPGGDDLPFVYSGTLVVQGQGIARVRGTGIHTEIGKIGRSLQVVEPEKTLLQKETGRLVLNVASVGLVLFVVVVIAYGLTRGDWVGGLLAAITLAMAILPEEFPVVLTVFLVLGAWRISQKQVLTRRSPAVETLGAATVLCVDKTGTLTLNRMEVSKIFSNGMFYDLDYDGQDVFPEAFHEIVEYSILASQKDPFDPMEKAFKKLGGLYLSYTEHLHDDWVFVREYPLSQNLLALSHVWRSPNGGDYVIAVKGAPEAIADLCHFTEDQKQELSTRINTMANEGLRILGVAKARFKQTALPGEQHDFNFEFLGLIGLSDPVRPTVKEALSESYAAGIRVIMITGDYPGTAQSIARQIGLTPVDQFITGMELDEMSDEELASRIKTVNICARIVPEQKLRVVEALKANGEIVAMTGDGVNDAPAMKSANIGIAMGGRGTDVARESSDLVLLDDDFSSIVQAVKLGRRIFDNIKKAMAYILAIHVPIAGLVLIPVLLNLPLVLFPVQIAFLELIIDPISSVAFEAEPAEANIMSRPPRNPREPLFSVLTLSVSLLQGIGVLIIILLLFSYALYRGQAEEAARAIAFSTLVIANLGLVLTNRSWSRTIVATLRSSNRVLWYVLVGALAFLGLVLYLPFLRDLFRFAPLLPSDLLMIIAAGIISIIWFETIKLLVRKIST